MVTYFVIHNFGVQIALFELDDLKKNNITFVHVLQEEVIFPMICKSRVTALIELEIHRKTFRNLNENYGGKYISPLHPCQLYG